MKILFAAYHDIKTEARTQEILKLAKKFGETYFVSYSKSETLDEFHNLTIKKKYLQFILKSIFAVQKFRPDLIILHDNYCSILIPILKIYNNSIKIIYDSSELYIDQKITSFKIWVFQFANYIEKRYLKLVDVVIAANVERANIMHSYFNLKETPLVFDNMHIITDSYNVKECDLKYSTYFTNEIFTILYAGGIAKNRKTYELVDVVGKLGNKYNLIIAGIATTKNIKNIEQICKTNKYNNIYYVGFIPRDELRYLLNRSNVSVSAFSEDMINNIYCASGKIYESIFEITPILTSENPPLKRLCEEYGVGISTNDFKYGILELQNNYDKYILNIKKFVNSLDLNNRINILYEDIKARLNYE